MQTTDPNEKLFRIIIKERFGKGDVIVIDKHALKHFVEHQYGYIPPN